MFDFIYKLFAPKAASLPIAPTPVRTISTSMVTASVLSAIGPVVGPQDWVTPLQTALDHFQINTKAQVAAFLAQTMFESGYFHTLTENLNYSAAGLLAIFSTHFTADDAQHYQHNPAAIANRAYANRNGNGTEASGDGWLFCGRGLIQTTGRANYTAFSVALGMSLANVPAYLMTKEGAAMSAAWFWDKHNLNELADTNQFTAITHAINGGLSGLAQRQALWTKAQMAL